MKFLPSVARLCALSCAAAFALPGGTALAQSYPNKPIRIVVPYVPGGTNDILARIVSARLQAVLQQPVLVDNKPGAGGVVGSDFVAKAAPDGYTLVVSSLTTHATAPSMYRKLPYDAVKDFAPITLSIVAPQIMLVNRQLPVKNVAELIEMAKKNPNKLTYGSAANGSAAHLGMELLKSMANVEIQHVPYKGAAPAVIDLIAGRLDVMIEAAPSALPRVRSGEVKAIASTGATRLNMLPDLATVAEQGLAGFQTVPWFGFSAPANTPRAVIDLLNREINAIMRSPDVVKRVEELGGQATTSTPEEYLRFQVAEITKWKDVVVRSGATVD